jgi:DNA-binding transcriptional LysR family regulator
VQRQVEETGKPVALRASSMLMHLEAIRAGTGRGVLPCYVGDGHPLLERLMPPIPEIAADYWVIVHRDLRRAACVRAVIDWMKALFAEQRDVLAGNRQGAASGASPRELDAPHVDHPHRHRRSAA